jgi:hypothetical protein
VLIERSDCIAAPGDVESAKHLVNHSCIQAPFFDYFFNSTRLVTISSPLSHLAPRFLCHEDPVLEAEHDALKSKRLSLLLNTSVSHLVDLAYCTVDHQAYGERATFSS